MKKPYTKNKKNTKSDDWTTSGVGLPRAGTVRLRKETQLDRIERKLDELLAMGPFYPVPWSQPPMPSPWYNNQNAPHPPTDHYGIPVVYCSANGGAR